MDQASMCPISPKGSPGSRIFPSRASNTVAATTPAGAAPCVVVAPAAAEPPPEPFMISATPAPADRSISMSATPRIAVSPVGAASPLTCPTWPRPGAITPTGCNRRPCDWWWRTTYLFAWPVGTCGATTASLSLGPPSRIGSRPRGKKSRDVVDTDYLERALVHFSGYLAADELYDGPFCVLSLVDNRAFVRLSFRVLERDPTQDDIHSFLADFKALLKLRFFDVCGLKGGGLPPFCGFGQNSGEEADHSPTAEEGASRADHAGCTPTVQVVSQARLPEAASPTVGSSLRDRLPHAFGQDV